MFSSRLFKSKLRYPGVDIERELADGGQATVYLGKLTEGDRSPVAVKVFDNKDGVREYEREVALLLRVGGHPNIVQVVRFHGHKKRPAIVTDLINGTTISDILDQEGAFPVPDAVRFGAEIANAVQHMHSRGVVHRDLKTSNIMLHLSGDNSLASAKPVIIDLGIGATRAAWYAPGGIEQLEKPADVPDEPDDVSVAIKGTREYMAPEMLRAQRWSEKSDSYAFGIVLWELITGQVPMGDTAISTEQAYVNVQRGSRPDIAPVLRRAGPCIAQLIESCWHHDPEMRPTMFQIMLNLQSHDGVAIFRQMDLTNGGALGFGAFVHLCDTYAPNIVPRSDMHRRFELINRSGSGAITFAEWTFFFWDNVLAVNAGWAGAHEHLEHNVVDALYALDLLPERGSRGDAASTLRGTIVDIYSPQSSMRSPPGAAGLPSPGHVATPPPSPISLPRTHGSGSGSSGGSGGGSGESRSGGERRKGGGRGDASSAAARSGERDNV